MRSLVALGLLILVFAGSAGLSTAEAPPLPCEEGLPPSGLYLERTSARLFEYDCLTGLVIPGSEATSICNRELDATTGGGICPQVTALAPDRFAWRFQVALITTHDNGFGMIQDEESREVLLACPNTPEGCKPVRHLALRWLDVEGEATVDCGDGPRTVFAHYDLWSAGSSIGVRADRADLC